MTAKGILLRGLMPMKKRSDIEVPLLLYEIVDVSILQNKKRVAIRRLLPIIH